MAIVYPHKLRYYWTFFVPKQQQKKETVVEREDRTVFLVLPKYHLYFKKHFCSILEFKKSHFVA